MGKQEIRQRARKHALGAATQQRQARAARERRVQNLVVQVLTAIGERDAAVIDAELRAGAALEQMTRGEGLSLVEAVKWCGDRLSAREVTRLRRLSLEPSTGDGRDGEAKAVVLRTGPAVCSS